MPACLPADIKVTANVGIGMRDDKQGFGLEVELKISLPGLDAATAIKVIKGGDIVCPYSHAIKDNMNVTLTRRNFTLSAAGLMASAALPAIARAPLGQTLPSFHGVMIGNIEVIALLDGVLELSPDFFSGVDPANMAAILGASGQDSTLKTPTTRSLSTPQMGPVW